MIYVFVVIMFQNNLDVLYPMSLLYHPTFVHIKPYFMTKEVVSNNVLIILSGVVCGSSSTLEIVIFRKFRFTWDMFTMGSLVSKFSSSYKQEFCLNNDLKLRENACKNIHIFGRNVLLGQMMYDIINKVNYVDLLCCGNRKADEIRF
eukprot:TRINITY_DN360_c1_g1_i5.p3 TRINITY_DN360_c1_g1~~TRINITY_DN360_c1_g1_i5.p3  ORF type:complete len:147 (-),score=2.12 TRINITY_DN360_c1_g1_i5:126-566(-)